MDFYPHYALTVAAIIFGTVGLLHLLRFIYKLPIIIAGKTIPVWISGVGFIFLLLLTAWMSIANTSAISSAIENKTFLLQSSAFHNGDNIPAKYTCEGYDFSPPLNWQGEPANTKSFALIVDDPDAPLGTWTHWIIINIPDSMHLLPENFKTLSGGLQFLKNSFEKYVYGGPCISHGTHRYYFKLYALDTFLKATANTTQSQIESEMEGHVLGKATLMGVYTK